LNFTSVSSNGVNDCGARSDSAIDNIEAIRLNDSILDEPPFQCHYHSASCILDCFTAAPNDVAIIVTPYCREDLLGPNRSILSNWVAQKVRLDIHDITAQNGITPGIAIDDIKPKPLMSIRFSAFCVLLHNHTPSEIIRRIEDFSEVDGDTTLSATPITIMYLPPSRKGKNLRYISAW
jgi:hypothetical protein